MLDEHQRASNGDFSSSASSSILVVDCLKVSLATAIYDARPAKPKEAANTVSFERNEVDEPVPVFGKICRARLIRSLY